MSRRMMIATLVVLLAPVVASANGPEIGFDSGTIFPVDTDRVQLYREMVHVRMPGSGERGYSEATYWLRNLTDETVYFDMAFVTTPRWGTAEPFFEVADFKVTIDRQSIPYRMEPMAKERWADVVSYPPDSLPVWSMSIPARDSLVMLMSHSIAWSGGGEGDSWSVGVAYVARPARLWAGSIEYARFMFSLPGFAGDMLACIPESTACYQIGIKPAGYRREGSSIVWEYHDWEPSEDFSFGMDFFE